MGATSRRQCGAGLDPPVGDLPPNLITPPAGARMGLKKLGLHKGWGLNKNMGARGLEPPNLTDVNRAL